MLSFSLGHIPPIYPAWKKANMAKTGLFNRNWSSIIIFQKKKLASFIISKILILKDLDTVASSWVSTYPRLLTRELDPRQY